MSCNYQSPCVAYLCLEKKAQKKGARKYFKNFWKVDKELNFREVGVNLVLTQDIDKKFHL